MSLKNLATNSVLYIAVDALMRGFGIILIPVYTRFLTPADYGTLTIITSITSLLTVFYTLGLPASSTRLYFEKPQDLDYVQRLWGTNITFIIFVSFSLTAILLVSGKWVLKPLLGNIAFYPYAFLGLISVTTIPFFNMYQTTLKVRQMGKRFSVQNFFRFLLLMGLTIFFVVIVKMDASGPLLAAAIVGIITFIYTGYLFGKEITWGIDSQLLKKSLIYGIPLLPHSLSGWVTSLLDRIFLYRITSLANVGLYNIGYSAGMILNLVTAGFNEAFVPYFMDTSEKREPGHVDRLKKIGLLVISLYVIFAIMISVFAKDLIKLLTAPSFHESWVVAPFIAFSNVLEGVYRLFVIPLFYNYKGTKFVSLCTFTAAGSNILFLSLLIPGYGLIGAGLAICCTQLVTVLMTGTIAHFMKSFSFRWNYFRIAAVILLGICGTGLILLFDQGYIFQSNLAEKAGFAVILSFLVLAASGGLKDIAHSVQSLRNLYQR
jgi:O-antigen/teichoic acid export membrane protein